MKEDQRDDEDKLSKYRRWFQAAVEHGDRWRREAREDYEFVSGKQWTDEDIKAFEEQGRPAITINRIKPLINVLSGYQRLNRYDIDFLPRTSDDIELCQVRRGVTKYVLDRCDYETIESVVFLDCAIGGLGWFGVKYRHDNETNDGEAYIERVDPFGMYIDPESHELDFSDAKYLIRAKWVDKDELKSVYADHAEEIDTSYAVYDELEKEGRAENEIDPLWYSTELKKVRLLECWYKTREKQTLFYMPDGQVLKFEQVNRDQIARGMVTSYQEVPITKVRCCVFFDKVLLEDIESPYEHGEFPYVPLMYHHYGVGDIPAGFVRDLKDPQREINKRRIQELHLLNTSANGGGWIEEGAMTPSQEAEFKRMSNVPGYFQKLQMNGLSKIREREPKSPPTAIINAEQQATADLIAISGINENLLGTDVPTSASGRAIELRQKQAITHLAVMFDALRRSKKRIAYLLWGKRGHAGIIPQRYTADKVYRVEGENGQQFVRVNQQVIDQDPLIGTIYRTLNDLSQGEFDIVIADTEASTTQRQAQLWSLVDSVSKLGIPGDMIFDVIIDLSDLPKKNDIIQRWQQRQQQQQQQSQQQAQAQIELERLKNQNLNQSISFKDAPLPIQMAMAAQQGIIDPRISQYFMQLWLNQVAPQLAMQMQSSQAIQTSLDQSVAPNVQMSSPNQSQPKTMTAAAARSVMSGIAPASV